jgi:hypothetical protein
MTIVTVITACNVCRCFSGGDDIVMTRDAGTDDVGMIHGNDGLPEGCAVAVLARVCRLEMRHALAGCLVSVVTIKTIRGVCSVIKQCRNPGGCLVAIITGLACDNVIRRFPGSIETVMARYARFVNG